MLALLQVWGGLKGTSSTPARETLDSEPYQLVTLLISFSLALFSSLYSIKLDILINMCYNYNIKGGPSR